MRRPSRRIRTRLEAGGHAFGVTLQLPSQEIAEIAGYSLNLITPQVRRAAAALVRAGEAVSLSAPPTARR